MRLAIATVFAISMIGRTAPGCSCHEESVESQFSRADAVFLGRVLDRTVASADEYLFTFDVVGAWKGVASGRVDVRTNKDDGVCGYHFHEGKEYLVFASLVPGGRESLVTGTCSGTTDLATALSVLPVIGPPTSTFEEVDSGSRVPAMGWVLIAAALGVAFGILIGRWRTPSLTRASKT